MTVTKQSQSPQAARKLNRWQKLLTAEQARQLPAIYSQDGAGLKAIAYVKFFCGGTTWLATEFDPQSGEFFGLIVNHIDPSLSELGYFQADELCARQVPQLIRRQPNGSGFTMHLLPVVERDLHFAPKPLDAAFKELTGRDYPQFRQHEAAEALAKYEADNAASSAAGN
jgi:hypothetical protein